jgi:CxxC-x17-CxxC domain-containing protein
MSAFVDKQIKCIECAKDFTYTAAEQELHKSLGYQNEPKRCTPCREAKRQRRPGGREGKPAGAAVEGAAPAEAAAPRPPQSAPRPPQPPPQNRGRDGRRDGGRGGDGRGPRPPRGDQPQGQRGGGDRGQRAAQERAIAQDPGFMPREFFLAICAECGKEAQLPFKPAGDRPVYCLECFAQKRTG